MQQNLDNSSVWRRRYVRMCIAFIMTCLVVALPLVIELVILSNDPKHNVTELLNNKTTPDNDKIRPTIQPSSTGHSTLIAPTIDANRWTIDSYLITKRTGFAAVVLKNGEVLVSGGAHSNTGPYDVMSLTEIYSPLNRKWRAATSMLTERCFHTLTILQNQKSIIAIGSYDVVDSYTAEIYDIEMNRWSYVPSIMDVGRSFHTATLLKNGQVLIVGGSKFSSGQSSAQFYDPTSNTFITTGSLNTARYHHTATLLNDGLRVLVTGGSKLLYDTISTAEIYASGFWHYAGNNMMIARDRHAAVLLPNGNVLVAGGSFGVYGSALSSAEIYDTSTSTFSPTKSMACARLGFTLTLLPSGKVLAVGGSARSRDACRLVSELYDPITSEWTNTSLLNTIHYDHSTVLLNNSVLLIGGLMNDSILLHECERYEL